MSIEEVVSLRPIYNHKIWQVMEASCYGNFVEVDPLTGNARFYTCYSAGDVSHRLSRNAMIFTAAKAFTVIIVSIICFNILNAPGPGNL